jgi:hypothetical protein
VLPVASAAAAGGKLTRDQAIAAAARIPAVREALAREGAVTASATDEGARWRVTFFVRGTGRAQVELDAGGRPLRVYTGVKASFPLARGGESGIGQRKVNALWAWLPLTAIFVLVFFDRRRPWRLLHLDLAVVAALGISYAFFLAGRLHTSVPLVYPPLVYLAARGLWAGMRPRQRDGPLTWLPLRALATLTLALIAARIGLTLADRYVIDVGYASVAGADRIMHGQELFTRGGAHFDTYGPVAYLAYIPFVLLWPFHESQAYPSAATAAAIVFELLTVAGLFVLGRRLRPGTPLGWALALAWVACPFTALSLTTGSNDTLISALLAWTLVALASAPARGLLAGAATAAKFAPGVLAPLLARGPGRPSLRAALLFTAAFAAVVVVSVVAVLPDGGVRELYDATIGFQLHRFSPFSLWSQHQGLDWLQTALKVLAVALAVVVALVPRGERTTVQVAGMGAAVLIAVQLPLDHWFYLYVAWFLPFLLVAMLAEQVPGSPRAAARTGSS